MNIPAKIVLRVLIMRHGSQNASGALAMLRVTHRATLLGSSRVMMQTPPQALPQCGAGLGAIGEGNLQQKLGVG